MSEASHKIKLFEAQQVRTHWDTEAEKWWFSVVDVIRILRAQPNHERARKYWSVMKTRMKKEGAEVATICSQLKMQAPDGKMRLTDRMSRVWSGRATREYKQHKGPKKENLRDNMTNTELMLNMLAEVAATDISQVRQPEGFEQSAEVAQEGAKTAKAASLQLEKSTGKPVVSPLNAQQLAQTTIDQPLKVQKGSRKK